MAQRDSHSLGDFLRRIAIDYVRYDYHRYVVRSIPQGKDVIVIDEKLCHAYDVTWCRMTRTRRRRAGIAVVQYLRWKHTFVLLATEGVHKAFNKLRSYNIRESPLHLCGYTIGIIGKSVSVQVSRRLWIRLEKLVRRVELQSVETIERTLESLPLYNFPGVIRQKHKLLHQVNHHRKQAGLPSVNLILPPLFHQRFRGRSRESSSATK